MSRTARRKEDTAIYHVMSRSIDEFELFAEDSDKESFLDILQKYKEKYACKIYAYCLMGNHYHIIIDTCGFDISKLMKCVNQSYVKFINKKYGRRGHLLAERFYSNIVDTERYLLTASAYIHNNPKDLPGLEGEIHLYKFSSMAIYTGKLKDRRNLVDTSYILEIINKQNKQAACNAYIEMVIEKLEFGINRKLNEHMENFLKDQYEYKINREVLLRNRDPKEIITKIANWFNMDDTLELLQRWKRSTLSFRRVTAYALTVFCGLGSKEACKYMKNASSSSILELSNKGYEIFKENAELKDLILSA